MVIIIILLKIIVFKQCRIKVVIQYYGMYIGHEISGIASHFAMHMLQFASQLHFCIANFAMQYS